MPRVYILRRRRARSAAALAVSLAAGAAPSPEAGAATFSLDRGCYLAKQPALPAGQLVRFAGSGFAPNAPLTVTLNGEPLSGSLSSGPSGDVSASFSAPGIRGFQATSALVVSDGTSAPSVPLRLTRLAADFQPGTGNPRTLRVRFFVYGFGPLLTATGRSTRQPVYMHVFDPRGRRRGVSQIGYTGGPCGYLRSARRRILPFAPIDGRWRYRFTTRRAYRRSDVPQAGVSLLVRTVVGERAGAVASRSAAGAAQAAGPALATARPCYVERFGRVSWAGTGFRPGAPVRVSLDGRPLTTVTASEAGSITGLRFRAPAAGSSERVHRLGASDGAIASTATFRTTAVSADLVPAGSSRSMLVRFRLRGFIPANPDAPPPVWLHYVSPRGRGAFDQRLDAPTGPCGTVLTRPRRLFSFRASPGTWRLQLDLRPAFSRRTPPPVARLAIPVIAR